MSEKTPQPARKIPKHKGKTPLRQDGLLPKQAAFVREYLICGNATQAAIRAGYSPKSAYKTGSDNLKLPQIADLLSKKQSEIAARQDERLAAMELTAERVARETARIAFFDPRKMFTPEGAPIPLNELDADTAACIVGLDVEEVWEGKGADRVFVGHVKKYKIADKNSSLERAAKILGMFEKDNDQKTNPMAAMLAAIGRSAFPVTK